MKNTLFIILFLTCSGLAKALSVDTLKGLAADTVLFYKAEHEPTFPGGNKAYAKYLKKNLKWPDKSGMIDVQGKVFVMFIVEKDGEITHARVVKGLDPLFNAEALRVVNNMPHWNPAMENGYIVRSVYTVPISFVIQ